ncbi:hypothetical protein BC833DRAFT_651442 [Globomyces pollinis-pini]|nr:hypothetical protein BC833DRAFT_651442 [Globomyces pollinis-pini]
MENNTLWNRQYSAYETPSGIFIGMGFHYLFAAGYLLAEKVQTAHKTSLWRLGFVTWLSLAGFIIMQAMMLDVEVSPYTHPSWYRGFQYVFACSTNILLTFGTTLLILTRVRLFYGSRSRFNYSMIVLAIAVCILKCIGNAFGMKIGYESANLIYPNPHNNPLYKTFPSFMAIALTVEGIFTTLGSVSFLLILIDFEGPSTWSAAQYELLRKEGLRLGLIVVFNIVSAVLAIWIAINDNFISHTGFYLPSLLYGLEFYSFLDLSYNSAKKIIMEQKKSTSKENKSSNGHSVSQSRSHSENRSHSEKQKPITLQRLNIPENVNDPYGQSPFPSPSGALPKTPSARSPDYEPQTSYRPVSPTYNNSYSPQPQQSSQAPKMQNDFRLAARSPPLDHRYNSNPSVPPLYRSPSARTRAVSPTNTSYKSTAVVQERPISPRQNQNQNESVYENNNYW